ncbi:hypothetical protein BN1080_03100 [Planococcus massiliensis]|uniref:Uncharacterized protein n=1 Tax=Planococcus massiliensis TaxID=1499687 RepID=A0A098ES00_9BACL|nr:hypothetical protein [Planococcus massiliensis]CEG24081.1 hypothetical protein BN1080_03100 [Planococcus massiliensis]
MNHFSITEIKERNSQSAQAIGFLIAGILAALVYGIVQLSVPAFLLVLVFAINLFLETREYKKSYKIELEAAKYNEEHLNS